MIEVMKEWLPVLGALVGVSLIVWGISINKKKAQAKRQKQRGGQQTPAGTTPAVTQKKWEMKNVWTLLKRALAVLIPLYALAYFLYCGVWARITGIVQANFPSAWELLASGSQTAQLFKIVGAVIIVSYLAKKFTRGNRQGLVYRWADQIFGVSLLGGGLCFALVLYYQEYGKGQQEVRVAEQQAKVRIAELSTQRALAGVPEPVTNVNILAGKWEYRVWEVSHQNGEEVLTPVGDGTPCPATLELFPDQIVMEVTYKYLTAKHYKARFSIPIVAGPDGTLPLGKWEQPTPPRKGKWDYEPPTTFPYFSRLTGKCTDDGKPEKVYRWEVTRKLESSS